MTDQWYYTQDDVKSGPCSGVELKELAAAGIILPRDIISREGVVESKLAKDIKNLFLIQPVEAPELMPELMVEEPDLEVDAPSQANLAAAPVKPLAGAPPTQAAKKGRALVVQGAVMLSQDGTDANYRKKCSVCAHEDSSRQRLTIRAGMYRNHFFCTKCRKSRPVVIQCIGG